MKTDIYGQQIYSEEDVCILYLSDPNRIIKEITLDKKITLSDIIDTTSVPKFIIYNDPKLKVDEFDSLKQDNWFIPDDYKDFDIAKYVLELCQNDAELQRVGEELLMFQDRNMFPLLRYLKYLVDTMRKHGCVWGVGRGSSVSSFVLFLIGIHRINSLYYDLSIDEFLK
jgi:DNA polymerase III alpha subunit